MAAVHLHIFCELLLQVLQQVAHEPRRLSPEGLHLSGAGILVLVSVFPADGDTSGNMSERERKTEMMRVVGKHLLG